MYVTLMKKLLLLSLYKNISIVAVAGLLLPIAVFGAPSANAAVNWFNSILDNFLAMILWPVFAALVVIMFVYAGFMYLTAHGDAAKVHAANRAVLYAVVGIIVAMLGFGAVRFIQGLIPAVPGSFADGTSCSNNAECASGVCTAGICQAGGSGSGACIDRSTGDCSIETAAACTPPEDAIYNGDGTTCP